MFVDVQGYTLRTSQATRQENQVFVREVNQFVQDKVKDKGGNLVKAMGDGFLITFESPTDAVACGLRMQEELERRNANILNPGNLIRFRIGISTGEVNIDDSGDVFGDAVNIAARIESFSEPNEVFIAEATYLAMNQTEVKAMDLGPQRFKNVVKEVRVYKILKEGASVVPGVKPMVLARKGLSEKTKILIAVAAGILVGMFWLKAWLKPRPPRQAPNEENFSPVPAQKHEPVVQLPPVEEKDPSIPAPKHEPVVQLPPVEEKIAPIPAQKDEPSVQPPPLKKPDPGAAMELLKRRDYDGAISAALEAQKDDPDNPVYSGILGHAYLEKGDLNNARKYLEEARSRTPGAAPVYRDLAQLYKSLGLRREAKLAMRKFKELSRSPRRSRRNRPSSLPRNE